MVKWVGLQCVIMLFPGHTHYFQCMHTAENFTRYKGTTIRKTVLRLEPLHGYLFAYTVFVHEPDFLIYSQA